MDKSSPVEIFSAILDMSPIQIYRSLSFIFFICISFMFIWNDYVNISDKTTAYLLLEYHLQQHCTVNASLL